MGRCGDIQRPHEALDKEAEEERWHIGIFEMLARRVGWLEIERDTHDFIRTRFREFREPDAAYGVREKVPHGDFVAVAALVFRDEFDEFRCERDFFCCEELVCKRRKCDRFGKRGDVVHRVFSYLRRVWFVGMLSERLQRAEMVVHNADDAAGEDSPSDRARCQFSNFSFQFHV